MAKNLKLTIKNAQIAEAFNLSGIKSKLASKSTAVGKEEEEEKKTPAPKAKAQPAKSASKVKAETPKPEEGVKEEAPKIRARSRSAFAEPSPAEAKAKAQVEEAEKAKQKNEELSPSDIEKTEEPLPGSARRKTSEELRREIFAEELEEQQSETPSQPSLIQEEIPAAKAPQPPEPLPEPKIPESTAAPAAEAPPAKPAYTRSESAPFKMPKRYETPPQYPYAREGQAPQPKLGPTGRHVNDLLPPKPKTPPPLPPKEGAPRRGTAEADLEAAKARVRPRGEVVEGVEDEEKKGKASKFKEFKDIKPARKQEQTRFDARDRQGLTEGSEEQQWRRRRSKAARPVQEDVTIRPTTLKIRVPIAIKDLASEMKLKASQLIVKLFSQGVVVTLNDILEDPTTIQLLGHEFGCDITIDSSEEERIRITDKTIREEIQASDSANLMIRPPVVAFMGHVDHGKTSLIDMIRTSNRAAGEAGAITQHIGAFRCSTPVGDITFLDTPGHEAFSAMRARGADVTDIVVLVVAGDEGIRQQTIEALNHAKAAKVTIVVAINKSDKPNFNAENVYRQLAENELLPEVWGGQTITVNCSAVTGEGIPQLLEMLALQAEVLELKADPTARARGSVLESEMHKGMGSIATVLVQNGTLRLGDALVFGEHWGRVKTMRNELRQELNEAGPSTPVEITGISGLPEAGQDFIVVKNEKEARDIADARMLGKKQVNFLQTKKISMENLFQQAGEATKKILNIVLRADVQGSLEALKAALLKIESTKAEINIIFAGIGEISESDVQLAAASKAVILGFHTQIESHADAIVKQLGIQVRLHDIIYHAIDDVKVLMAALLDKIAIETEKGKAEVKATFKSSQLGVIAGCIVTEGAITRNNQIRIRRDKEIVWKGTISSLKRVKEDVREVAKGLECGIVLNNFSECKEGDILEAYEITYITQEL